MMLSSALFLLLTGFCALATAEDCKKTDTMSSTVESRLLKDLMCGYTDDQRPVKNFNSAVNVVVRMLLKYVTFDEKEETLSVHSWLGLVWKDEFLQWNPDDYGGIKEVQIDSNKIWQPKLSLYNADAEAYSSSHFYTPCTVSNMGTVRCVPHVAHRALCSTKLRDWPYDTQNCTLSFGSWMHTGEQVNFTFAQDAANTDSFTAGAGWTLVNVTYDRNPGHFNCCPNDTFPSLRFHLFMRRLEAGPAAIIVVPSIVVVLLTLTALLLDVKDNTRLCLSCFSLFGHFTFLSEIGYDLPKHSSDTPIILLFLRDSMILSLIGILLTLLLSRLRHRVDTPHVWITKANSLIYGRTNFAIFTSFEPELISQNEDGSSESVDGQTKQNASREWTNLCNVVNSLSFIAMVIIYCILLMCYIPRN